LPEVSCETAAIAVARRGELLQLLPEAMRSSKPVVMAAVQSTGVALQWALCKDLEVAKAAVGQDFLAMNFVPPDLLSHPEVIDASFRHPPSVTFLEPYV
jgi:hypothetical protein